MTKLSAYLSRKIEALKNPTIPFEPDPVAEEGLIILQLYDQAKEELRELQRDNLLLQFDVEAEKRNVAYLERKKLIANPS